MKRSIPLIIIFLSFLCSGCGNRRHHGEFDSDGKDTLKVVTLYGPLSYFIYRGEQMGIDYENVRRFADEEGYELDLKVAPNITRLIEMLKNGDAQLAAYPVPFISEYNTDIIHCGPKEVSWQVLVQKDDKDKIEDVTQLIGKNVFVENNSKYHFRLINLDEELGGGIGIKTIENDTLDSEDYIGMVNRGIIDYTVTDSETAHLNEKNFPRLDMSMKISLDQAASWAVAKSDDNLAIKIDNWEKKNHDSPLVKEIYKKYYDSGRSPVLSANLSYFKKQQLGAGDNISAFDNIFKRNAGVSGLDWKMLAAIAYCESGFNPDALSRFGATGLMQVMPASADAVGIDSNTIFDPESNVTAAARILSNLNNALMRKIPSADERIKFVLASYNSGLGHIYDSMVIAEKHGLDPKKWTGNVSVGVLMKSKPEYYNDPDVKHGYFRGRETVDFVEKVLTIYQYLKNLS